jgi:DNA-binding MarR family transcriptional regulator
VSTAGAAAAGEVPADSYLSESGASGLFTRLARVGLLLDAFQHRCLDRFGLRFVDYSVLRILQLNGKPYEMTPTELTELVLRSSGGMTQILDRLQSAGYVERASDQADRRKVVVRLTPAGVKMANKANTFYAGERNRLLSVLEPQEVAQIDGAVRRLLDVLRAEEAGL